jgi:hypothetical protein
LGAAGRAGGHGPDCKGTPGLDCPECEGTGKIIYRTCPRCGDIAWDYINDRREMVGRISFGYQWTANDPGWLLQQLPRPQLRKWL